MYAATGLDIASFEQYRLSMREYRDKFVAHLDLDPVAHLPRLDTAWLSVCYYHAHVVSSDTTPVVFRGLPVDITDYHTQHFAEANSVYAS
jgi:hypothetical protein